MADERAHLELADRHIREAKKSIVNQETLIQNLITQGHDTINAEAILQAFRDTLDGFLGHRALIVEALAKQGLAPG